MKSVRKGKHLKEKVKVFKKKTNPEDSFDSIIAKLLSSYSQINPASIKKFVDFPLSPKTLKGLAENDFKVPTKIQRESLGFALQGQDILGAAKTGSGKTLAFIIPVLEVLFVKKWTHLDGLGALIITPVRELAYQIFETLRKVGCYHDFSAGLIIGGKDLHFEKSRMHQVNIVICTPGRLLQHMDENPLFDCANLQILVLDEADRCLDMGFEKDMNNIIENLPMGRQTLLFSATQTKSVRDLARLSLKDPKYVSVHEHAKHSTPDGLTQSYIVCELYDKLALLWSFVKNHRKQKILVFLSSCKQVKYMNEIFCKLRAPTAILALHGALHQLRRMEVYRSFTTKQNVVLFATDVAARGLDFPEVNWVVQMDCPEDSVTYIHRAGRTARYQKGGESLLVLLPSEKEAMLQRLEEKKIPINEIKVNPMMFTNPQVKIEAFLARDPNLKASAQRAFVAYFKSVFLMKDKKVFQINALDTDSYARSLGLVVSPRIRFLQRQLKSKEQNRIKKETISLTKEEGKNHIKLGSDQNENETINKSKILMRSDDNETNNNNIIVKEEASSTDEETEDVGDNQIFPRGPVPKGKETYNFGAGDSESEDDLFVVKRRDHDLEGFDETFEDVKQDILEKMNRKSKKPITKMALAKKMFKKNIIPNKKKIFTEDGEVEGNKLKEKTTEEGRRYEETGDGGIDITEARKVMKAEDKVDRRLFRDKVKAKHRERRLKDKKSNIKEDEDEAVVYSGNESEGDEPDLSWLPDPDKIYGPQQSGDSSAEEKEEPQDRRRVKKNSKRKKTQNLEENKRRKVGNESEDEPEDTGLSLLEDEELALQFLSNKR